MPEPTHGTNSLRPSWTATGLSIAATYGVLSVLFDLYQLVNR